MNTYYKSVQEYFNGKADSYDDVDDQLYWVFSDIFYKEVLKLELGKWFSGKESIKLLDAGAGTGRWTSFIDEITGKNCNVSGTLIDMSVDMLRVAEEKFAKTDISDKYQFISGYIEQMDEIENDHYDMGISFYNVLNFVENPEKALREIYKKLKSGGYYVAVVGNTYHAIYFSLMTQRLEQLDNVVKNSKIRFNDQMPDMKCFTPDELGKLFKDNGFKDVLVLGGPNFLYPGMEETFVHGSTSKLQGLLEDDKRLNKLLLTELKHYKDKGIVGRANTLLVMGKK